MTLEQIMAAMREVVDGADGRALTADEVAAYEALETDLTAARADQAVRGRQTAYETPVNSGDLRAAGSPTAGGVPSLILNAAGLDELRTAITERRSVTIRTENVAVTTTQTGKPSTSLGVTANGGPVRIAELGGIQGEDVEWGGTAMFPILGAGTPPVATGEGAAKPQYDAVTPGTATPQTLAIWTDLSNQSLSIPNIDLKLRNKLARLVAQGENELLRAKVAGTTGVVTQAFVAGDQSVQILRSAAIIEAGVSLRPNLMLYNPADTAAIFGTAVANAAPQEVAELSVSLFGMASLPLNTQPAGFVLMGAWAAGSRLVWGLRPTYATDPFSQMKNNLTTVLLEEAVDIAVEEPTAFRTVDIVTP